MGTKLFEMNKNRSYTEMKIDNVMRVMSCKTNCKRCQGRFAGGVGVFTQKWIQCSCVKFEDIGVRIAGNVTLTRKDN